MSGYRNGEVELLGFEVIFRHWCDSRGSVWVPVSDGLNLLYGKNGAGKTDLLEAIKRCVSGQKSENSDAPVARMFLRMHGESRFETGLIQSFVESTLSDAFAIYCEDEDWPSGTLGLFNDVSRRIGSNPFPISIEWLEETTEEKIKPTSWIQLVDTVISAFCFDKSIGQDLDRVLDDELSELVTRFTAELRETRIVMVSVSSEKKWEINLAADIRESTSAGSVLYRKAIDAANELIQSEGIDLFRFVEVQEAEGPSTVIFADDDLLHPIEISNVGVVPFAPACGFLNHVLSVEDLPFVLIDIDSLESIESLLNQTIANSNEDLATFLGESWNGIQSASAHRISADETDEDDFETSEEIELEDGMPDDPSAPGKLFPSDPLSGYRKILMAGEFSPVEVAEMIKRSLLRIQQCGSSVQGLEFELQMDMSEIAIGRFVRVFADDVYSHETLVHLDNLSTAQQRLINMFVKIEMGENSAMRHGKSPLLIGDEIDSNMHRQAVTRLHRTLGMLPMPCLIATHAFEALTIPFGKRLHVSRKSDGGVEVSTLTFDDLETSAQELGTSKESLLGLTRTFVLVEGSHDKTVFDQLLSADTKSDDFEIRVLAMRGANDSYRLLDSALLDYSDADIVVVMDNTRIERIRTRLESAQTASQTKSTKSVKNLVTGLIKPDDTHEEKMMSELIAHAAMRGMLSRVHVCGLSEPDIIRYFNPSEFGVPVDWDVADREYRNWRQSAVSERKDFKTFLVDQYQARFGGDRLLNAVSNLDSIPADFVDVLRQIGSVSQSVTNRLLFDS